MNAPAGSAVCLGAGLSSEEAMFLEVVVALAAREVAPLAGAIDADGAIPDTLLEVIADQALDRLAAPDELGGGGGGRSLELATVVSLAEHSAAVACWVAQRQAVVAGLVAAGRAPEADVPSIADAGEAAVVPGDAIETEVAQVLVTGHGVLLVGGPDEAATVHLAAEGTWTASAARPRTGLRGLATVILTVQPTQAAEIGGPEIAARVRAEALLGLAACAVGVGSRAVVEAAAYMRERHQFGRPLARFGALQGLLANASASVAAASAIVMRAGAAGAGTRSVAACQEAARVAAAGAVAAADTAVQIHGGYGYIDEYDAERLLRDALTLRALTARRLPSAAVQSLLGDP